MGYRRVTSLGRQLSGTLRRPGPLGGGAGDQGGVTANEAAARRQALARQARRGLVRGTIRFTRDARRFSRDVREGMDLYLVRHRGPGKPYAWRRRRVAALTSAALH